MMKLIVNMTIMTCYVLSRWIISIKASIKKWLPLHQALQDYMSQPPEETRM